jgi:hypothetical protein
MEKTDKSAEESFVKYLVVCYGIHDPLNLKLHVGFVYVFFHSSTIYAVGGTS